MNSKLKNTVLTVLLFLVAILFFIIMLLYTPIDYWRYRRTRYYQDTGEKYSWLCAMSFYIKLYDCIKKEQLPIKHYRVTDAIGAGYGYFVYQNRLVTGDYQPLFNSEKKRWEVEIEDEWVDLKDEIAADIERCNAFLQSDVCEKAIVLIDADVYEEHTNVHGENFELLPVTDDNYAEALKTLVDKYN